MKRRFGFINQKEDKPINGNSAKSGLEQLAFGGIGDAVKLLHLDEDSLGRIEELNLFNVSKVKKTKDGYEVEVFDRLKALEALDRLDSGRTEDAGAMSLYEAIAQGAAALSAQRGSRG